jgi:hypothetical protein
MFVADFFMYNSLDNATFSLRKKHTHTFLRMLTGGKISLSLSLSLSPSPLSCMHAIFFASLCITNTINSILLNGIGQEWKLPLKAGDKKAGHEDCEVGDLLWRSALGLRSRT